MTGNAIHSASALAERRSGEGAWTRQVYEALSEFRVRQVPYLPDGLLGAAAFD